MPALPDLRGPLCSEGERLVPMPLPATDPPTPASQGKHEYTRLVEIHPRGASLLTGNAGADAAVGRGERRVECTNDDGRRLGGESNSTTVHPCGLP